MIKVITGNEAAAYGALLSNPQVVCAYPITPQTQIPEQIAKFKDQDLFKDFFNLRLVLEYLFHIRFHLVLLDVPVLASEVWMLIMIMCL